MGIPNPIRDPEYLADGVYICHDGYQLWIRTGNHHFNREREGPGNIALDSLTFSLLIRYAQRVGFLSPSAASSQKAATSEEPQGG